MSLSRGIMLTDAAGCGLAALAALTPAAEVVAPSTRQRRALGAALLGSSMLMTPGALRDTPGRAELVMAAAANAAWVGVCLVDARRRGPGLGRTLVVATAALDAVAGLTQACCAVGARRR